MRRFLVLLPLALALAALSARAQDTHVATEAHSPQELHSPADQHSAQEPHSAGEPRAQKHCLPAAETREEIKARHLREPFAVLKLAALHFKAEALSARLCRIDDEFVYEVVLLHRDGKFFHAHVNAMSGKIVEFKRVAPPPGKT